MLVFCGRALIRVILRNYNNTVKILFSREQLNSATRERQLSMAFSEVADNTKTL